MAADAIRYARPEAYRTPLAFAKQPIAPCSFELEKEQSIDELDAWLEQVSFHWLAPTYAADLRRAFEYFLGPGYNGSVLEVGCGMGHLREVLGIPADRYTGVDVNDLFLEEGRRRYPGTRLIRASAEALPFPADSFDCVLCADVLIHLEDMRPALRELIRVSRAHVVLQLRSGDGAAQGTKTIYDPSQQRLFNRTKLGANEYWIYYNVLAPEDLARLLAEVGVSRYDAVDLLPANADRLGVTKVCFDVRQIGARPPARQMRARGTSA